MIYGIAGNTRKEQLWDCVARLIAWLNARKIQWYLHEPLARGMAERELLSTGDALHRATNDLAGCSDIILSFGGDGTLLRTAHAVNATGTPVLGINIGRLGFLTEIDAEQVTEALTKVEANQYDVHERVVISVDGIDAGWALNDVVISRSGSTELIALDVSVNDTPLNRYWGDGLIIATPTGSTAYSLAVGGPIVMPQSEVLIISPIAPHSLTVRPVVLPASSIIEIRVHSDPSTCQIALDGRNRSDHPLDKPIVVRKADHSIRLVSLPGNHYLQTLRSKLSWGSGPQQQR